MHALAQHAYTDKEFEFTLHTPLMFCARYGKIGSIRALLAVRADINERDADGATALHIAVVHLQKGGLKPAQRPLTMHPATFARLVTVYS